MPRTKPHEDCSLDAHCSAADCPAAIVERRRAAESTAPWHALELGRDAGGPRHYLAGRPVHCGTMIVLQAVETRADDRGSYHVLLAQGVRVRYEAALYPDPPVVTLHTEVAGHEVVLRHQPWMRFRWPA
jgi:hypothetical protein